MGKKPGSLENAFLWKIRKRFISPVIIILTQPVWRIVTISAGSATALDGQ